MSDLTEPKAEEPKTEEPNADETKKIQQLVLKGFGIGLLVSIGIFLSAFGGSYMMNRLIYHGSVMRAVAGILGSIPPISLIIFIYALTKARVPYFSLFPLGSGSDGSEDEGGLTWRLFLAPLLHPFRWVFDKAGYVEAIGGLLAAPGAEVVNEALIEKAQAAAKLATSAAAAAARAA